MTLTFLQFIFLYCLDRLRGERTIYSIYHLLTGKKSAQTIQDGKIFHLLQFFKTYDELTRVELEETTQTLLSKQFITHIGNSQYKLTGSGKEILEENKKNYYFLTYLDGWRYEKALLFWQRLALLVQVASNINYRNSRYFPIQKDRDVQNIIKFIVKNYPQKYQLSNDLHQELKEVLTKNKWIDPTILVIRLTGYNCIGLTKEQAYDFLKIEKSYYDYQFLALLHFIIRQAEDEKDSYPILCQLSKDLFSDDKLTLTAKKTYELIQKGYCIEEIAAIRNLKENTIYDHIVEIAMQINDFSITSFIEEQKIKQIIATIKKLQTKKLKRIYEALQNVTYFEIRLVLAKYGEHYETID